MSNRACREENTRGGNFAARENPWRPARPASDDIPPNTSHGRCRALKGAGRLLREGGHGKHGTVQTGRRQLFENVVQDAIAGS